MTRAVDSFVDWFRRNYLSVDPRTLGFFRMALALLLLGDLAHRMLDADLWYANDGLLPNHTGLWRPMRAWVPSVFWGVSEAIEARGLMALVGLVYLALLFGYRTRLAQLLSLLAILSLQIRVDILSNGGDFVLSALCVWTVFLPLGRRYSVDALLGSAGLPGDTPPVRDTTPVVSLAVLAATVQFAAIYFFNTIHKTGDTWMDGTAVFYMWQRVRQPTAFAVWARDLPVIVPQVLSWSTLIMEGSLPLLILLPFKKQWFGPLAVLLVVALHGGIALSANLGVFSYVMMVYSLLLLSKDNWDWLESMARRRYGGLVRGALEWERRSRTWLRRNLDDTFGLSQRASVAVSPSVFEQKFRRLARSLREGTVLFLMFAATLQMLQENRIIPEALKPNPGRWHLAVISYTRLQQGWQMFAPDVPKLDVYLRADATTIDGRHIDPIAMAAGTPDEPQSRQIPRVALGLSVYFVAYMSRIDGDKRHHRPLSEWVQNTHRRTGRPQDEVVSFVVYAMKQRSPDPGQTVPRDVSAKPIARWTKHK